VWFRYHHLFAEFLQAELARGDEAVLRGLHARAAEWYETHGAPDEAIRHWLAAGDAHRAGLIVCRAHLDYASRSRHETILRWIESFTDEQILADPALTIVAGNSTPMTGDVRPRARRWLAAALRLEPGDGVMPGTSVPLRAFHAIFVGEMALGGVSQMLHCGEDAVRLSRSGDLIVQAAAQTLIGQALWLIGDSPRADPYLRAGEEMGAAAHCLMQVTSIGIQALALEDQGRWQEAHAKVAAGISRFDEAELRWAPPHFPLLLAQVRLEAHERGRGVAALVGEVARFIRNPEMGRFPVLTSQVMVAEALADIGDVDGAGQWLRNGLATLAAYPDAGILGPRLRRVQDLLEERRLAEPLTAAERRVLQMLPSELSEKEIAQRLAVSPQTVHSHVAAVYRKLDVHDRSEAVERARTLRLLVSSGEAANQPPAAARWRGPR
jgi:LuxR family maltose regulon positive regulatory protein